MALLSKDHGGESSFEPVPAGTHIARCVSVVDLGVQETPWGGKEKVYIGFEVPGVRVEWKDKDGKEHSGPALIGSTYTNSINEKSILGQHLTSWRGKSFSEDERKGFDLFSIIGVPCMINVVHNEKNGKTYANIVAIMRPPQGTDCPPAETDLVTYSPMDASTSGNFEKLPEWLQKRCRDGYKMAEGDNTVGSANRQSQSSARDSALAAAHGKKVESTYQDPHDHFDDDIPF